jgi:tetratricopeptide (TPR) repeat protein
MSLYYCNACKSAFLPEKTITDGQRLFCKKCKTQLSNLGSEAAKVSLEAHLASKNNIGHSDLYHNYQLIQSKSYQQLKKSDVLIDCESRLQRNPLDTGALFTLAKWYYSQGLKEESIAILKQIIKIDNQFLEAHDFLSQLNSNRNADLLPNDIPTLEEMGITYLNSNNLNQAVEIFEKILILNPKHVAAQRYLADIFTELQQFDKVIHIFNRLSLQFPDDATILFNLAVACYNSKDLNRAKSNLKAARKMSRNPELNKEIEKFLNHLNLTH